MKYYKDETGRDLWSDILGYYAAFTETQGMDVHKRMHKLSEIINFDVAAKLFHAVIRGCNSSISLAVIEDAMFNVGILPSERDSEMSEPWPLVLVGMTIAINNEMIDFVKKKKPQALKQ